MRIVTVHFDLMCNVQQFPSVAGCSRGQVVDSKLMFVCADKCCCCLPEAVKDPCRCRVGKSGKEVDDLYLEKVFKDFSSPGNKIIYLDILA